jgi:hypothetical protein
VLTIRHSWLYSWCNKKKPGFGRVRVTHLNVNFGLDRTSGPRDGSYKILMLRLVQTSTRTVVHNFAVSLLFVHYRHSLLLELW